MAIRSPLRNRLLAAWRDVVEIDYAKQRINSERALQAALWARLNALLPERQRMFIEPPFPVKLAAQRCIPDIVICSRRRIIAVIEIKYRPRGKAAYKKDVRSLDALARRRKGLSLSNSRFEGPAIDETCYTFSINTLFVWAGFHRPASTGSYVDLPPLSQGFKSLAGKFMQLHAETSSAESPRILYQLG